MIYVLVYRSFDYYKSDEVVAAALDSKEILEKRDSLQKRKNMVELRTYIELSEQYKEDYRALVMQEIPHFVIMEFKE